MKRRPSVTLRGKLWMISRLPTPFGYFRNQIQRDWFGIKELDGSFAGLVSAQALQERLNRFGSSVQTEVLFVCGKMDDIMPFPIGGHTPGDPFLRFRECRMEGSAHCRQAGPDFFRLHGYIFVYGFWFLAAKMGLIRILKRTSALGAFPHGISLPSRIVYQKPGKTYSPSNSLTMRSLMRTAPTRTKRLKMSSPT